MIASPTIFPALPGVIAWSLFSVGLLLILWSIWVWKSRWKWWTLATFILGVILLLRFGRTPSPQPLSIAQPTPPMEQRVTGDNNTTISGNYNQVNSGNAYNFGDIYQVSPTETVNTQELVLCARYGGEWQGTDNRDICFRNNEATLHKPFIEGKQYWFVPAVANLSTTGLAIDRTTVFFNFSREHGDLAFGFPDEPNNPDNPWQDVGNSSTHHQYAVRIGGSEPGYSNSVSKVLLITFPRPGRYLVTYSMSVLTAMKRGFSIQGRQFYFELTE